MTSPDILKATELVVKTLEDLDIPYYIDEEMVEAAVRLRSSFNLIHLWFRMGGNVSDIKFVKNPEQNCHHSA